MIDLAQRDAVFLIAAKHGRRKGFRLIRDRLTYARKVPQRATLSEVGHGRAFTWTLRAMPAPEWAMDTWPGSATIIAVSTTGMGCGKPVDVDAVGRRPSPALSLRVCASSPGPCSGCSPALGDRGLLALGPARAPAGRKPSLKEVTGVQILATLRTMGLNALRLVRMTSIAEGIAAMAHDILAILRLRGWREVA